MKNSDIKYNLSTDYTRLYQLLKAEIMVVGFIAVDLDGVPNMEYSKLVPMSYNSKFQCFDLGFSFFEQDFTKIQFPQLCEKYNVRFVDLNQV